MGEVVFIHPSRDLSTQAQNRLRCAMELGVWRADWRRAEQSEDHDAMDRLQIDYERVGLP